MTEVNAEIITPFGPSIFKVKIPKQIIDDLNQYVDNTVCLLYTSDAADE